MNKAFVKRALSLLLTLSLLSALFLSAGITVYADEVEAMIGSTEYSTVEQAFAEAKNGDVVTLLKDSVVEESITIDKTLILRSDNSASIIRGQGMTASIFSVSVSLTVIGVTLDGAGVEAGEAVVSVNGGTLTFRDGSSVTGGSEGGVYLSGGTFNFSGGSIYGNSSSGYGNGVFIADDVSVFNLAGTASLGEGQSIYMPANTALHLAGDISGSSSITIYTEDAYVNRLICDCAGVNLSGEQVSRFKLFEGETEYVCTYTNNGIYVDKPISNFDEARIGEKKYATLTEALEAAAEGDTVTILGDVYADSLLTVKKSISLNSDGNYTVYCPKGVVIEKGAALNVGDENNTVTFNGSGSDGTRALLDVKGSLVMGEHVTVTSNTNTSETASKGAVYVQGSFTMKNGSITGNTSKSGTVYIDGGSFVMQGGSINGNSATTAGGVYIASGSFSLAGGMIYANTGEGVWNGGSFELSGNGTILSSSEHSSTVYLNADTYVKVADGWSPVAPTEGYTNVIPLAAAELKLGRVMAEFSTNAVADNFKISDRYEGKFALLAKDKSLVVAAADEVYTVYWENNPFMTLSEAIAALPQNTSATLKIVGDLNVTSVVTVPEGMNIVITTDVNPATLEDYTTRTVKRGEGFTDNIFQISKGATLTLGAADGKELIFDGEGKTAGRAMAVTVGSLTVGVGVTIKGNYNKAAETLGANSVLTFGGGVYVEAGGNLVLSGGSIVDNYASYGGGVYLNNGAFGLSEGKVSGNSALYGGGVYLESNAETPDVFASLTMTGGSIESNKAVKAEQLADSGAGGGVYIDNGSLFAMSKGSLKANTGAYGAGVCVGGNMGEEAPEPQLVLSGEANIASDNSVHLSLVNISRVTVTSNLSAQSGAITLSLPPSMPQNMTLVEFIYGENALKNAEAAQSAYNRQLFVLEKGSAEYFAIHVSPVNKATLINTAGEIVPSRAKAGEHFNGLARYEETESEEEEKVEILYPSVVIPSNGSFTAHFEMSYYSNLYDNVNTHISAAFPVGTRIVMIDRSDEENIGYYYYEVSGEETVIAPGEVKDQKTLPARIEIPLTGFYAMGGTDSFYTLPINENTDPKAMTLEKLLFTVDFVGVREEAGTLLEGDFTMELCNSYPSELEGERHDISSNMLSAAYTVSDTTTSEITLTCEENSFTVNYTLNGDSTALAVNSGVILFQIGYGNFPRGSVITTSDGKQYVSPGESTVIAIPLPTDEKGNILPEATARYTLSNYYGTALVNASVRCVIAPSSDGAHYTVGSSYDAQSEGVKFDMEARDSYSVLVTTTDGEKKPYYEDYKTLTAGPALEMSVSGLANTTEVDSFNLSLLKKDGKEYVECSLSELFNVSADYGYEVILSTGNLSLDLAPDLKSLMGNEYKIVFKVGDAVEYVKVNVTEEK